MVLLPEAFGALLAIAPDATLLVGEDGLVRAANARAARLFGYGDGELAGVPIATLLPDWPARRSRARGRDGRESEAEVSIGDAPLADGPGRIAAVRDATRERQLEARLRMSDRFVSVGTLAGGVAHEINNPLAYVIANLALIDEEVGDAAARARVAGVTQVASTLEGLGEPIADAREGAERVRCIVSDLRTFARSDEERVSTLALPDILDAALGLASNELRQRARVEKRYDDVPPVCGNEARLGQVILNLLVNAAQAIPEGHVEANRVQLSTGRAPDGSAVVEVTDTGCGIAPEHLPRLFDPFFTTKPVGVGTGLGLSICHSVVTAMGGEILVESTLGVGTRVTIKLPPTVAGDARAPEPPAPRRARILVVDDEPSVGTALKRLLQREHDVDVCTRAAEALDRLAGYDVVLCDLMMPQMSGMDLHAAAIARDPALAERMVFITGGAFTPRARQFLDQVPNARLDKPFDPRAVRRVIAERLRR